jgi:hypothetical protein
MGARAYQVAGKTGRVGKVELPTQGGHHAKALSVKEICSLVGIGKTTFYR